MAFFNKSYTTHNTSFKKAKKKASNILQDPERLRKLLANSGQKLRSLGNDNESLQKVSAKVMTFNRMLKAYMRGEYREIPWKNLLLITAGIVYFVTPLDLIPDFIPIAGYLDDLTVLMWVFNAVRESIEDFEEWEKTGTSTE